MDDKILFQQKLAGLLTFCAEKGNVVEKEEVIAYFEGLDLTEEQMVLVFDYLLAQKVLVKRYVKAGELAQQEEKEALKLTEEEEEYLKAYEADLQTMKTDGVFAVMLPEVVALAKEMNHPDIFLGDLIQEGNMGLMTALSQDIDSKEQMMAAVREGMQLFLESQTETKRQDKKMAEKVNHLDEEITKLTEEMGRKITIDELAQFLSTSEEEIEDILKLAGEEVGEIDESEL